ncbi:MAG: hypothetical protein R6V03_01935 [Kiritimatiellia bacterium]
MEALRDIIRKIELLLLLSVLPLVGILLARKPLSRYLEFPPVTLYVKHAGFSWTVFAVLSVLIIAVAAPFIARVLRAKPGDPPPPARHPFPWWFWAGLVLAAGSWLMAWTRFDWFEPLQSFTFSPIWLGYILTVNGLTFRRTGHCMLRDRPAYFLALFAVSAVFWWYFEYLNRFVQNWHYRNVNQLSPLQYFVFATFPFSTVLPAVLGTKELLASFPHLGAGLDNFVKVPATRSRAPACVLLVLFCAGLAVIGVWPDYLFPLLWVSPLFILTSFQAASGRKTVFSPLARGNWREICLLALSALICGFFWEMWNYYSFTKWKYTVPFVNRFRIFEMPALGYSGYLPFGLECAVVANFVLGRREKDTDRPLPSRGRLSRIMKYSNAVILCLLAVYFFLAPGFLVVRHLSDPDIGGKRIPRIAWNLHRDLTPRYERWARARIASGKAGHLPLYDVPSTEWPMFGSVYYLWATEALQEAWEEGISLSDEAPRVYARATIEAAVDLIMDPVHHTWVRTHWGRDYMRNENVFFRSLIIAGLTSRENLIRDGKYNAALLGHVDSLASELDASPHGVLEDYPDECYPIDVLAAIACIKRADSVLGTDHADFLERSIRAFEGDMLDGCGLIPYLVEDDTGRILGPSRGVGNSYTLIFAPELWPERAREWYARYEEHFWQDTWWASGFREYPRDMEPEFADYIGVRLYYDVDAGPIIGGFSPAANAFGLAAAKVNGRLDHAYTLGTQVITASWPLPDGSLLGPRILSSREHAPYLGEACMLFFLAQRPRPSAEIVTGGHRPGCVYIGLVFYFGVGAMILVSAIFGLSRWKRNAGNAGSPCPVLQFGAWVCLVAGGCVLFTAGYAGYGMLAVLFALFFPR